MNEQRKHPRTALTLEVKVSHDSMESVVLLTRDISESGVFVVTDNTVLPPVGFVVEGQVQGTMEARPGYKWKWYALNRMVWDCTF